MLCTVYLLLHVHTCNTCRPCPLKRTRLGECISTTPWRPGIMRPRPRPRERVCSPGWLGRSQMSARHAALWPHYLKPPSKFQIATWTWLHIRAPGRANRAPSFMASVNRPSFTEHSNPSMCLHASGRNRHNGKRCAAKHARSPTRIGGAKGLGSRELH